MSYPKQSSVMDRLHSQTLSALDGLQALHKNKVLANWTKTRRDLRMAIFEAYRQSTPEGRWNLHRFKASGAQGTLRAEIISALNQFQAVSTVAIGTALNVLYRESLLRHAWMLDQVTPDSNDVLIPSNDKLHESAVRGVYVGLRASRMWETRWNAWTEAYNDALNHNLALGALNESSLEEATNEVDATKANTPASTLEDALERIYDYEATLAVSSGASAIGDMNGDLVQEEVWKTRGDLRVCDDCDANEGFPIEETGGEIPLHPNCNCYWMLVPKSYAALLQSGNDDDRDLADQMLLRNMVPNALVIRDDDGDIAAKVFVDFKPWTKRQGIVISTR